MSHPPARPALMVITPGRFDLHRFIPTKKKQLTSSQIQEHTKVPLMVTGDIHVAAVTPVCSSGKYPFLGVTHVRSVAVSPARLICPLLCAAPVFASMTHFTFLIKKMEKPGTCLNNGRKVCGTWSCHLERGMRNVKQMS